MKKKKMIGAIVGVCIVLVIGIFAVLLYKTVSDKNNETDESNDSSEYSDEYDTTGSTEAFGSESEAETAISIEVAGESNAVLEDEIEGSSGNNNLPDGSEWRNGLGSQGNGGSGTAGNDTTGDNGSSSSGKSQSQAISFPYTIPNTNLTIQSIASYDGIFLEDGSDSDVSGIASVVLKNGGSSDVEYAYITLNCDGNTLNFEVSDIAAGASVVAQESNKTAYTGGTYTECSADVAEISGFEMSGDEVKVEEKEDGSLAVTNLTNTEIPCVRVFYKFYMEDENAYIGGITYTAKLTSLEANGTQTITPSHYSAGYSKVVMVRTYDTAE